jgi:hypothetical protein
LQASSNWTARDATTNAIKDFIGDGNDGYDFVLMEIGDIAGGLRLRLTRPTCQSPG